ncbi:MAG: Asp-tRNA(Asn)/Glu-tRNA(Gln) amidotransferase subunit GatC [Oscillospiraceae bacterium]
MMDVNRIAQLARIEVGEKDIQKLEKQMQDILLMVEDLPQIDEQENFLDEKNPMTLRKDEIRPSLKRDLLLQNAPKAIAGCIVVPKVVD